MNKFLIIDGNSLVFRAYYALPYLSSTGGQPTGAIFGFMNMLLKVLEEYKPTHVAVAFDFSRKTFRNKIYSEYKGTRKPTPDELRSQFPILKELLKNMGIKYIEKKGIEADDIIGTLSKIDNCETVILSGDRDVLQLIDESTQVWLTKKGISEIKKVNLETLFREIRLKPYQIIEVKALMGDSSDNIPGIRGVGPKTAHDLISQFDNIENVFKNLDNPNISSGLRLKLDYGEECAIMSKKLATIKCDCDINLKLDDYQLTLPFNKKSIEIIADYDMNSLLSKTNFFGDVVIENSVNILTKTKHKLIEIDSLEQLSKIIDNEKDIKVFSVYLDDELLFSFDKENYYLIKNEYTLFYQPPEIKDCLKILKPILEDATIPKILCDYKKFKHSLQKYNLYINGKFFDVKLASYLLSDREFDEKDVGNYSVVKEYYKKQLKKEKMENLYYHIELPLEEVLYQMEVDGFKIDKDKLSKFSELLDKKCQNLTTEIYKLADEEFNINSPKQLGKILFTKLQLPVDDNKKFSTGVEILTNLIGMHPIIEKILEYRKVQKLKSSYVDSFKTIIEQNGEIIHTIFNQMLTSTGRLSSSEPNLQNLPVKEEEGKEFRKVFVSRFNGGKIISADYNQIELRLLAHCSGDKTLITAFNNNMDIHALTASQIFGVDIDKVTPAQRRDAKAVNFGIIYGISGFGLSQNVHISRRQAQDYIDKYFDTYPNVKKYMDKNVEFAKRFGFAKTLYSRRRKIPEINSKVYATRQFGMRVAMNMPLQGSASDIIKMAMLEVFSYLKSNNLKSKLILQIHDELVIDCPKNEVDIVAKMLREKMENIVKLSVKLPVGIEQGDTLFDV